VSVDSSTSEVFMHNAGLPLCTATLLASIVAITPPLAAQSPSKRTSEQIRAPYDAHKGEFDHLLCDWEFTSQSPEFGPEH